MREILFRGKRVDEYGWVFGDLIHDEAEHNRPRINIGREYSTGTFFHAQAPRVIPETVGQFTGLTDKNGNKIFEGDIVKFLDKGWKAGGIATVDYEYGKWKINGQYTTKISSTVWFDLYRNDFEYEIIGNIHDNPELLEVQNER